MDQKRKEYFEKLTEIFIDVFDDDDIELQNSTSANDIEEWDSLMHISLVVATEKEFNVRLNAAEVSQLKNVGEMIDLLLTK